jgi:hypothetical protein
MSEIKREREREGGEGERERERNTPTHIHSPIAGEIPTGGDGKAATVHEPGVDHYFRLWR